MRIRDLVVATASVVPLVAMAQTFRHGRVRARTRVLERAYADATTREQALEHANRAHREFLARFSHDLRTPLTSIVGFAELLQLDHLPPDQAESVRHITDAARQMLDLLNEVLDITRIEAGRLAVTPEPVHAGDVIREVTDVVVPLGRARDISLVAAVGCGEGLYALADHVRLRQVLLNLVSNAVKYNRRGGVVTVSCGVTADRIRIYVQDTGAGIPADKLKLLFTPFERLGAEQSGVEGTGLGLVLSRRLTEAMGGTLGVDSKPGEGSNFWIDLPASVARAPAAPAARPPARVANVNASGLLLYVEDDLSNAQVLRRLLAHRPLITLRHANDGETAAELLRRERPALVLLDLDLPDISGEELLRQIRRNPATREVPVAVLSADASPAQRRRLLAAGARAYLTKPFNVADVLALVDSVMGTPRPNPA